MKRFLSSRKSLGPKEAELNDKTRRTSRFSSRKPVRTTSPLELPAMDAPPPYTPENTASPGYSDPTSGDSQYAYLKEFDIVFLIDNSGSMSGQNWTETRKALEAITPVCTYYDEDGIDIYFMNQRNTRDAPKPHTNVRTSRDVEGIFNMVEPYGATPTGDRLRKILTPYIESLEKARIEHPSKSLESIIRPLNIIVITDGAATDDVEKVIKNAARKLDKLDAVSSQVGIQFFQVGRDPVATQDLRDLDDELNKREKIRDMVDTVSYQELRKVAEDLVREGKAVSQLDTLPPEAILKVLTGAVSGKVDRQSASDIKNRSMLRG